MNQALGKISQTGLKSGPVFPQDLRKRIAAGLPVSLFPEFRVSSILYFPGGLSRLAHKIFKNRLRADFLPPKLPKEPDNRGFYDFFHWEES
jgi:hypothetical protein